MLDITVEQPISLAQAAEFLPANGNRKKPAIATVFRMIVDGHLTPDGARVHLEALRLGNRWITSREAIQRFMQAQTPKIGPEPAPIRTPSARRKAVENAKARLQEAGI